MNHRIKSTQPGHGLMADGDVRAGREQECWIGMWEGGILHVAAVADFFGS